MNRFTNGHKFAVAISLAPPPGERLPLVEVRMSGPSAIPTPVVGKLDTGAFRTMLSAETAKALGHVINWTDTKEQRKAQSASGHDILYYERPVLVRVEGKDGQGITFPLDGGFSEQIRTNLFGIDWVQQMCIAVDEKEVHFLRD